MYSSDSNLLKFTSELNFVCNYCLLNYLLTIIFFNFKTFVLFFIYFQELDKKLLNPPFKIRTI